MDTLAPWAEPVLMTADELLHLPEDGWRYELVDWHPTWPLARNFV